MCDALTGNWVSAATPEINRHGVFVAVPHPAVERAHQQLCQLYVLLAWDYAHAGMHPSVKGKAMNAD